MMELNCSSLPNKKAIRDFIDCLKNIFYPGFFKCDVNIKEEEDKARELFNQYICDDKENTEFFFNSIPVLKEKYLKDLKFTYECDPACDSYEEIISCYPGFTATFYYRIANLLYALGIRITARFISEQAHFLTGIDINPGAQISSPLFIDHGTGIVIGETAIIGHHVKIYQGVTLGALALSKGHQLTGTKRHPTIGNYVTIYSGASILGGDVKIGDNVVIGSNVFLMKSIPSNTKVVIPEPKLTIITKEKK